jgi:hypothetical protein
LVRRGEEILKRAKEDLDRLHGAGRGHLVSELKYEIERVEFFVEELKGIPHSFSFELHQIHYIEEQLLKHENRLSEEVRLIEAHNELEVSFQTTVHNISARDNYIL